MNSHNQSNSFKVIGDPIIDIYNVGHYKTDGLIKRFVPEAVLSFHGGAANVAANAAVLLGLNMDQIFQYSLNYRNLILSRYIDKTTKEQFEIYSDLNHPSPIESPYNFYKPISLNNYQNIKTLVLADYNKGTLNKRPVFYENLNQVIPLLIADSRYQTINEHWFDIGGMLIWRCTGNEYDKDWAKNFRLIVQTDGSDPIKVYSGSGQLLKIIEIPTIQAIDTVGAGDTFTATLAAYLHQVENLDYLNLYENVLKAIPCAVRASQEVCQQEYTAVTTYSLYDLKKEINENNHL